MENVPVKDFSIGEKEALTVICGPCVIESREHTLRCAEELKRLFAKRNMHFIFKASYDKANRSSILSPRGPGIEEGLEILRCVQKDFDLPVITDVHNPEDAKRAGEVCDMIQIPAFLCRQTDLLLAAGMTQKAVNVKKGQFMSPQEMENVVEKIRSTGNRKIVLVDRGTMFGYNHLINDMRAIPIMQSFNVPVCFDATHSVQKPGGHGTSSSGERQFVPTLAKAAIAAGANALFIEAHPHPEEAKSDKDTVLPFSMLPQFLDEIERLYECIHHA